MVLQISVAKGQSKNKWFIDSLASHKTHFLHPFQFRKNHLIIEKPHEDSNIEWYLYFPNIST
jgi:hypothetical protein